MVNLVDGYIYKIIAARGLAANVPTLLQGQLGWDTDKKTGRYGDGTSQPPRVMTDKSTGSFNFESVDFVRFSSIQMVNGGKVDGIDLSTMNQSNGLAVRIADGQMTNRILTSGNDSISIANANGVDGDFDIRVSDSLIAALRPPKFFVDDEEPSDAFVGDFWHDRDGGDNTSGNADDGVVYIRNTNGVIEYWTQISNEYQNASETAVGLTRYATTAEALARVLNTVALTPRSITALIGAGNDYRTVLNATTTAPPGSPVALDAYLIPISASGVWASHVGKIATWDGADWVYDTLRVGAMVVDSSKAADSELRYLKQTASLTWGTLKASDTALGLVERATEAEVLTATDDERYVTSKNLRKAVSEFAKYSPIYPECLNSGNLYSLAVSPGQLVVSNGNLHVWRGNTLVRSDDYLVATRTFNTIASQIYHLRWYAPGHARAIALGKPLGGYALESIGDFAYNPSSLLHTSTAFDSTYDSMLIAVVSTNGSNILTVTPVRNAHRLFQNLYSASQTPGSTVGLSFLTASRTLIYATGYTFNWARYPIQIADVGSVCGYGQLNSATTIEETAMGGVANNMSHSAVSRHSLSTTIMTDFVDITPVSFASDTVYGIVSLSIEA